MIAGFPWATWLLLAAAVAPGLGLALGSRWARREDRSCTTARSGAVNERGGDARGRDGDSDPGGR